MGGLNQETGNTDSQQHAAYFFAQKMVSAVQHQERG